MPQDGSISREYHLVRAHLINIPLTLIMQDDLVTPAQVAEVNKRTRAAIRFIYVSGQH